MEQPKSPHLADPREGEFTPTSLQNYTCPRKWYFKYNLKLIPTSDRINLKFGSAMHVGIGTFYIARSLSPTEAVKHFGVNFTPTNKDSFTCAKILALKLFSEEWASHNIRGNEKKNLEGGILLLDKYCDVYKGDSAHYIPTFIECPIWIEMPNGTQLGLIIDRIQEDGDYTTIVDTKTSGWPLTDYFFKRFENDQQMSAYFYAITQIKGRCDAIQIDGIQCPLQANVEEGFVRRTFLRTELQIADWLLTYLTWSNRIMESLAIQDEGERLKAFPCDQNRCADYGGCPYLPICKHGLTHPDVQIMFEKEER